MSLIYSIMKSLTLKNSFLLSILAKVFLIYFPNMLLF